MSCCLSYFDSDEIAYFLGLEFRSAGGVVTKQPGQSAVKLADLIYTFVYRRHIKHIRFREPGVSKLDMERSQAEDDSPDVPSEVPVIQPTSASPTAAWKSVQQASHVEEFLREDGRDGFTCKSRDVVHYRFIFTCNHNRPTSIPVIYHGNK